MLGGVGSAGQEPRTERSGADENLRPVRVDPEFALGNDASRYRTGVG